MSRTIIIGTGQSGPPLAARLAELQAASTRLDALGERLAQIGQLSLDEFDFSTPAPLGGPEEYEALRPTGGDELRTAIDALGSIAKDVPVERVARMLVAEHDFQLVDFEGEIVGAVVKHKR